jgi:luciferase family oxidoreductase group 1
MQRSPMSVPFSLLDLCPIPDGSTAADALRHSLELARRAEALGYRRFWLAEHHNMPGIASAATAVVIAHVATGTSTIRVGAGGIMLPNHSPLIIAEQFGTLAALHPNRIDLGVGRAPGTDPATALALGRGPSAADDFPRAVQQLQFYFRDAMPGQPVRAVPGAGLDVPIWILGSSLFGAQLAAALGLPYAFAAHFAPDELMRALHVYRTQFKPSVAQPRPWAMVSVNVVAADTDAEASRLFTSMQQAFTNIRTRGVAGPLPTPVDDIDRFWSPAEKAVVEQVLRYSFVGSAETVERNLRVFLQTTKADELMITAHMHSQAARLRSIEIAAEIGKRL